MQSLQSLLANLDLPVKEKTNPKPNPLEQAVFADFETTGQDYDPNDAFVAVWGVKDLGGEFTWGTQLDDFLDYLHARQTKKCLFHNLSFDGDFIWKHLVNEHGYKFIDNPNVGDIATLKQGWFTWIMDSSFRMYSLAINWKGSVIMFNCTYLLLMEGVGALGARLGFPKGEYDYRLITRYASKGDVPSDLISYLERDIDIVVKAVSEWIKIYQFRMTQASVAQNEFELHYDLSHPNYLSKKNYRSYAYAKEFGSRMVKFEKTGEKTKKGKDKYRRYMEFNNVLDKENWEFVYSAYSGGFVAINPKVLGKLVQCPAGISYDINSSYPHKMADFPSPYGKPLRYKPQGDFVEFVQVRIKDARLKDPRHPPILKDPTFCSGMTTRYLSAVGKWANDALDQPPYNAVFDRVEWDYIRSVYEMDYTETKSVFFRAKLVYSDWITEINNRKMNAKSDIERQMHKLIMNAKSGKDGQNETRESKFLFFDPQQKLTRLQYRTGKNNEWVLGNEEVSTAEYRYVPAIAHTTALARLQVYKAIALHLDDWLYCDTDSIYIKDNDRMPLAELSPTRLGAWKAEYKFSEFKAIKLKCYRFTALEQNTDKNEQGIRTGKFRWVAYRNPQPIMKSAGVSEQGKRQIATYDQFKRGTIITNGKRQKKFCKHGYMLIDADITL